MELYSKININVKVDFGIVPVEFTVIDILPNFHYALLAQNRLVVGQLLADMSWKLSHPIDLLDVRPIPNIHHK